MADITETTRQILIEDEMRQSYLTFAMSVIVSRALPDVRDGLKPVQRRILVAMNELSLGPRSKHRKCGKVVGDTHGNYHPHGDVAIYEALVRMAQPFSFRCPVVDGQGNFGSLDGDPPAAMRYTAVRLSEAGAAMLEDLELDTVDFTDNYEGTRKEPVVLPSKFPNLLVNGASGIAVGMATSMPPHNVREVCDALIKVIDNPGVTISELLEVLPGPDFPTGGLICGREGIAEGYATGRGNITVRARTRIEDTEKGRQRIVVTEIPYHMNHETLMERIAAAVDSGSVQEVSDLRNESDRTGTRIVLELKRDADPELVLRQLFHHTPLQSTFSIMLIVIADGRPVTLNIKELLEHYVEHRVEVIRRRTSFQLTRAEDRAHILEGLLAALVNLDEVIKIVRTSQKTEEARERLMTTFALSEAQANAILAMRLQSLVGLERLKVEQEHAGLLDDMRGYRQLLSDRNLVLDVIREDLYEIRGKFGDERRTTIVGAAEELLRADLVPEEDVVVTLSHSGYIKRLPVATFRSQGRGGKGVIGTELKEEDLAGHIFVASTHDYLMLFTSLGLVYWLKVYEIPEMGRTSKGRALVNLLALRSEEGITGLIPVKEFEKDYYLLMATASGRVKKTTLDAFGKRGAGGIIAMNLPEGDRLVGVRKTTGEQEVVLATRSGKALRFNESDVRPTGRTASGVRGMRLKKGDSVVDMALVSPDTALLTVCENGYGKRTAFAEYPGHRRGGQGVLDIKTTKRNGSVVAVREVREDDEVMLMTSKGMMVRIPLSTVRCIGRNTRGVRLVRLEEGDKVTDAATVMREEVQEPEEVAEDVPTELEGNAGGGSRPPDGAEEEQ